MRCLLFVIFALIPFLSNATHLIGGEITYSCLGANQYEIQVSIYIDCGETNTNNTGFDSDAIITIYDGNNNFFNEYEINLSSQEEVEDEFTSECVTLPDGVCIEKGTYSFTVNLPNNSSGYQIVYQRCCRNEQVINIDNPGDFGSSLVAYIPPSSDVECNNSPEFTSYPPLALCLGSDIEVNQSASDLDSDDLVYSFVAPYHGSSDDDPTEVYPPPYFQVPWDDGYSDNNPIGSNPVISIDSQTGLITGTPNQEGFYVVGIKVEEYRDGVYLGEIIRDFRFLVVDCEIATSSIPIADIYCDGLQVDFENESENAFDYLWDFGDSQNPVSSSSAFEPTYTYPDSGSYEVSLIANPGTFCADTASVEFSLYPDLFPSFETPETNCDEDALYDFVGSGVIPPSATFTWDFGENAAVQFSNELSPSGINFNSPGVQEVTFSVSYLECEESFTSNLITAATDIISIQASANEFCEPDEVAFTLNTTTPSTQLTYDWNLGNGSSSTAQNPIVQYQPGTYDVSLAVVNELTGCESSIEEMEFVTVFPQPVSFFEASQTSGCEPLTVYFDNLSSDANQYSWLIDGAEISTDTDFLNTFTEGTYEVTLQAISDIDCAVDDSFSMQIEIYSSDLFSIETSANELCAPDMVSFTSNIVVPASQLVFNWDFGNGLTSDAQNPSIQFQPGTYDVSLAVVNILTGCESELEELDWVTVYAQPEASIEVSETSGCAPLNLTFSNTSSNANQFNWFVNSIPVSSTNDFSYNFSEGTYTVMLQATSDVECAIDDSESIQIQSLPEVVADFDVDYSCNQDMEVQIQNNSENASSLSWSFGDGVISNADVFSHSYTNEGDYVIELLAENPLTCNLLDFETVAITVAPPPDVSFELVPTEDCEEGFVQFENTTLLSAYDDVTSWAWDFGNGTSSSAFETSYTFAQEGVYTVELNVLTESGCEASYSDNISIDFFVPISQFSYSIDTCTNHVMFFNESESADNYFWDFGNGLSSEEENPIIELNPGNSMFVTLTASNELCSNSSSVVINFSLETIYDNIIIPNVFSPNGDYKNDVLLISGIKECQSALLRIYNRWGDEVYYSLDPYVNPWNGFSNSEAALEGVYFYVLEMKYGQLSGTISLFR